MNQYQACAHYHTANGFLPAKYAEEFEERKEALIQYAQTCVLNKIVRTVEDKVLSDITEDTLNHLLQTNCEDTDELEEAIQILTDEEERYEINRWYKYNGGNTL